MTPHKKEGFSIVWPVLLLRSILEGNWFTICSDHVLRKWILNLSDICSRLAQWRIRLLRFSSNVVYSTGIEHQAADALFRLPTEGADTTLLKNDLTLSAIESPDDTQEVINFADTINATIVPRDGTNRFVEIFYSAADILTTSTIHEFLRARTKDVYCHVMTSQVENVYTEFHIHHRRLLVQRSPIDGTIQIVVSTPLLSRIVTLASYPRRQEVPDIAECVALCDVH